MQLFQYVDLLVLAVVTVWLLTAILVGPRPLSNPMLWFCLGTAVFLQVGALRDHWTGVTYPPELEMRFRWLEAVHVASVFAGYRLGQRLLWGGRPVIAGARVRLGWFLVAAVVANVVKLIVASPFEQFDVEASNYSRLLQSFAYAAAALAVGVYHQSVRNRRGAEWLLRTAALSLVFLASAFSLSRTPVMYSLFVLLMYVTWRVQVSPASTALRRLAIAYLVPIGAVGLLTIGSLVKGYTSATYSGGDAEAVVTTATAHGTSLGFIDAYENGMFVLETYPSAFKYRFGESIGALVLGPVPRSLWPEKPMGFSHYMTLAKVGSARQDAGLSLAPSLVGDFWGGGGWPNVIVLSLFLGIVLGFAARWHRENQGDIMVKVVYWQVLFMAFLSARGDVYTIYHRALVLVVFTVVLMRLVRANSPAKTTRTWRWRGVAP